MTKTVLKIILLSLGLYTSQAMALLPTEVNGQGLPTLAPMLERSMPAVVNISTSINVRRQQQNPLMNDPVFRYFFGVPDQPRQQQRNSLGSGVIIDKDEGYILTNNHVIEKADVITVTLSDGRQLNANVLGTDPEADVAVIQIPADNLTEIPVADSSTL
ncbi:MAG: trypsin-like peptidase domain-containing protein, partial [Methylomonas sp.]|nr:trypsin-like peptidase domain-containing protein [Methylomonas sp.]